MFVSMLVEYIIPKPMTERRSNANTATNIAMPRSPNRWEASWRSQNIVIALFSLLIIPTSVAARLLGGRSERTIIQPDCRNQTGRRPGVRLRIHRRGLQGKNGLNRV